MCSARCGVMRDEVFGTRRCEVMRGDAGLRAGTPQGSAVVPFRTGGREAGCDEGGWVGGWVGCAEGLS